MKIVKILLMLLGVSLAYRLGRALYMQARGDIANDMSTNGELMIQRAVIRANQSKNNEKFIIFDVGANIGDWSLGLLSNCRASQCHSFELYAFEPVPSTASVLRERLGNDKHVHYESFAMSSDNGADIIYVSNECSGTNSLHCEHISTAPGSISINKITASQFCLEHNINAIQLLKIDTEGHDMDVILGSLPLLNDGKIAVLQFEYNHRWIFSRHYLKDVFDAIKGLPYRIGKICPNHIEVYEKWYPENERYFEANYVLLRSDVLSWFEIRECNLDVNNTLSIATS